MCHDDSFKLTKKYKDLMSIFKSDATNLYRYGGLSIASDKFRRLNNLDQLKLLYFSYKSEDKDIMAVADKIRMSEKIPYSTPDEIMKSLQNNTFKKTKPKSRVDNSEILKAQLNKLDIILLSDANSEEIRDYLINVYRSIKEDENYYKLNPYANETGMEGGGLVSNYTRFYRIVSQKLYLLADTNIEKSREILKLLPPSMSKALIKHAKDYAYKIKISMEKTSGLRKFKYDNKWGFINSNREVLVSPIFDDVSDFNNGIAKVVINGLMAVIDTKGNYILEPKYQWISGFHEGFAIIKINDKYGFMNSKWKEVIEPKYERVKTFSNGVALVIENNHCYYIDRNGRKLH